jgi:hypothetical protein
MLCLFVSEHDCSLVPQIVWLHEFQKFEDRPNAINLTTREISPRLIKLIFKYIKFEEKLVVGRPEYKEIIEELLVCVAL